MIQLDMNFLIGMGSGHIIGILNVCIIVWLLTKEGGKRA